MPIVSAAETSCVLVELAAAGTRLCDRLLSDGTVYWHRSEDKEVPMEVYLDLLMLLNFLVDFLLLTGTNRLAGFPCECRRAAAAAVLGGVYSGACLVPGFRFLGNLQWRVVCLGLMAGISFGWNRSALRRSGVFLLLSFALGGLAMSMNRTDIPGLVLCALMIWLLCSLAFADRTGQRDYIPLEIRYGEKRVRLLALRDTGNTLRDPVTAQQVLIISMDAARKLTGLTEQQLRSPMQTMLQHPLLGLRLIPFRTVGQPGGMLLAMQFEDVTIGSRKQSAVIAFDTGGLGSGEVYQALTGGVI